MGSVYVPYSKFIKEKFPENRVFKISLDAGFSCPHKNETGGCTYCLETSFAPEAGNSPLPIADQVLKQKKFYKEKFDADCFILYFQTGSNTYGSVDKLKRKYDEAISCLDRNECAGISIATRADLLSKDVIALLADYAQNMYLTVEIGMESVYDKTLKNMNRGHDFAAYEEGIASLAPLVRKYGVDVCAHVIFGYPGETVPEMEKYDRGLVLTGVTQVKFHQLQVIRGSVLDGIYHKNPFPLIDLRTYAYLIRTVLKKIPQPLVVQRFLASSPLEQVVGPRFGGKNEVLDYILAVVEA